MTSKTNQIGSSTCPTSLPVRQGAPAATNCNTPTQRAEREIATAALFLRAAACGADEREQLFAQIAELNYELARGLARPFKGRGVEPDDLEQVAMLGLVKAVHHYRLEADTPFIGFAIPTIRGEIRKYFRDHAWTLRIPRRLQELQGKIATKIPILVQRLQREPTRGELATELGVDETLVNQALAAKGCFNVLSLDSPGNETNDDFTLADAVADAEDPAVRQLETIDILRPVLADLKDRERTILQLRFVEGWTQQRIGESVGLSQMHVSRILKVLLADLRQRIVSPTPA